MNRISIALASLGLSAVACAENTHPFNAAAAFGARESASALSLSPDGMSVAFIAPARGQGAIAYTISLKKGSTAKAALSSDGKPYRLSGCDWVSNDRLICRILAMIPDPTFGPMQVTRMIAVDTTGKNIQILSTQSNSHSRGIQLGAGRVIDWLPDETGAVLMTRDYLADDHAGSKIGSSARGLAVDRIDTATNSVKHVEPPRDEVVDYISDGRGNVRIMVTRAPRVAGNDTGVLDLSYRLVGSREWRALGAMNVNDNSGFNPFAVDHELNVAYGLKKKDGRQALYSLALDGSKTERLIFARDDVDVSDLIQIGRRQRVVGAVFATEKSQGAYFAPEIGALVSSLAKAVPRTPLLQIVDSSTDENRMLVFAGSDSDPGVYYIFDRTTHQLETFLVARGELEGAQLASVKPVTYPAADGTSIPAYLTLPPGQENAKGLPAIVLPHGGPASRDAWGFDWLAQFFAARGFAVLQPNYRGSAGYGENWFKQNGFKSWPVAIGDVLDGGRWLVSSGVADQGKLAIVGWSYGGYAALQSAVVDPGLFKAVVAIAPVTDLGALKEEHRNWTDFEIVSRYVGDGEQMHAGSPIEHVDRIKAPVLLFHGDIDRNVGILQSQRMAAKLKSAGNKCELVTWEGLDHQLEDSSVRAQMLSKSDEFLRAALGM